MSNAQISTLLLIWSAAGIVAEVPSGALADRYSRRASVVVAGVGQAAGYVVWLTAPTFIGFAIGFVLWGVGASFGSGAFEALLYDNFAALDAADQYPRVYGRVSAMGLLAQIPAAAAATLLFATGGYDLVGWVSVGCCLGAALVATRFRDLRPPDITKQSSEGAPAEHVGSPGYLAILRSGLTEAARHPAVRATLVAAAVLGGLDGLEEYFPLMAHEWGIATATVPLAVVGIPLVGAAGAALAGYASTWGPRHLTAMMTASVVVFGGAMAVALPIGVAGIAIAYGLYRLVLVVANTRLQECTEGNVRATVTSIAALGNDLMAIALYAVWATDKPLLMTVTALTILVCLPGLLRTR